MFLVQKPKKRCGVQPFSTSHFCRGDVTPHGLEVPKMKGHPCQLGLISGNRHVYTTSNEHTQMERLAKGSLL